VDEYRVVYEVDNANKLVIGNRVRHRREVYRQ
jgi:mRNA-degrading endonuclease RelE of RelBE toxin-antitoxin system